MGSDVELRQLEHFVAVAEDCHFTRAAQRLHIAQSGLSASIRSLERELGAPLFSRTTRQVRLTPEGEALLVEARKTLSAGDAAKNAVAAVRGLLRGSLRIGSLQCLHAVHVPGLLAGFVGKHPGLEVSLRHGGSGELIDSVRTGRLDIAFVSRPSHDPGELLLRPLDREPLVLACALDHRFADCDEVKLQDLAGERFVDFPPDWSTRDLSDQVLTDAGVERRVALEASDVHSLLDLVSFGLGVALVPRSFTVKTDRARFIPLAGDVPQWETVAVAADPAGAAATALLRDVETAVAPPSTGHGSRT